jgi:hypothetical protein
LRGLFLLRRNAQTFNQQRRQQHQGKLHDIPL